jgi:para-aminobenzoate synthetase component 1
LIHVSSLELLELAKLHQESPGTVLLYSGGPQDSAKQSFLFLDPSETITIYADDRNPWEALNTHLKLSNNPENCPEWVGYLSYEMGAFSDPERPLPYYPPTIPLAQFFKCEKVYVAPASKDKLPQRTQVSKNIKGPDDYLDLIRKIQEEIRHGDVYQVNLSHELKWPFTKSSYDLFLKLIDINPAPFAAYLKSSDFSLISSSPERLLLKTGQTLETRPIKGTLPRGATKEEDEKNSQQLLNSEKDRAELLMITDLMRNDLGKVSLPGSVNVDALVKLEAYQNVFHLISIIHSTAKPEISPVNLLRSIFPGGSITGCPKQSAMQSIHRHEKRPRGIYTGSIGYFTSMGDFDFNIAIRTLLHQNDILTCALGGAIVADSLPISEYNETLAKGASIFRALEGFTV